MEAVFICAGTKKLFCLKFSYRELAPDDNSPTNTKPQPIDRDTSY